MLILCRQIVDPCSQGQPAGNQRETAQHGFGAVAGILADEAADIGDEKRNRRRQAEMLVFEDTSSGTLSLVPSVASVSAVPSSASAGSSACASPLQRRNSAELLGAPLPPESSS